MTAKPSTVPVYERIGGGYADVRRPDPRWITQIHGALAGCSMVLNVGAGSGSYEPDDRTLVALEPSPVMLAQRSVDSAPAVRGRAERLPFADGAFDVALAVLTIHHWDDAEAGLAEMRRVAPRQVVVTWDPDVFATEFWLTRDYLPEASARERGLATVSSVLRALRCSSCAPLLVPFDCTDGFFGAYWRRPRAYLDPRVRAAISGLALQDQNVVQAAMQRLASDLDDGTWDARYADLLSLEAIDLGYRLVVAER
jgi:SAM-dependent methyltransferase